jgi:hypothetical protein
MAITSGGYARTIFFEPGRELSPLKPADICREQIRIYEMEKKLDQALAFFKIEKS